VFGFFLLQCHVADASELRFAWDIPENPDQIGGYYIYWGVESRNYVKRVHLGKVYEATVKELDGGNDYYFAVTCYQTGAPDIESDFSNEVVATIEISNQQPIADAGADQIEPSGTTIFLDGSNSSDPDGDSLSYAWTQVSGPNVTLYDAGSSQSSFALPTEGVDGQIFSFQLTVKDPEGLQSIDTCSVKVFTAFSSEEDTPAAVDGTEGIDVSGTWDSVTKTLRKKKVMAFTNFKVKNLGTENVKSVKIEFYQSEDNNFDESDFKISEHVVRNLKVGATIDVALRIEYKEIGSVNRLIAVIDPSDNLVETNEENNISISSVIQ
jgi:hypothetical protein